MIAQRAEKYAPPATEGPVTYRFTSIITCAKCGKHFRRKLVRGKPIWICPTFNYEGKAACPAKQIPEEILEEITADMDMERLTGITADDGNRLLFHFWMERLPKKYGATVHAPNPGRMRCGRTRERGRKRGIRTNDGKKCNGNTRNENFDTPDARYGCEETPCCRICACIDRQGRAVHVL